MKFRAVAILVLFGLVLLFAACGKGKESSPKDDEPSSKDDEKPKSKRASASASGSGSPLGASLGDVIPSLGGGHSGITGLKAGVTVLCYRDTMSDQYNRTFDVVEVGTDDWVRVTGGTESELHRRVPRWLKLNSCEGVVVQGAK